MNIPLLMTASIDTRGMRDLSVTDLHEREGQYLETFAFYLKSGWVDKIVFVENSGYDLQNFKALAETRAGTETELISCDLNDYPRHLGKSYGEMRLLDHVLDHSELLQAHERFIKVTGRFPILNMDKLLREAGRRMPWELFCDSKDHPVYDWLRNGWNGHAADTRFFVVTKKFYQEHFYGRYVDLNDAEGRLVEGLFFDVMREQYPQGTVVRRFRTEPEYAGKGGHRRISIIGTNEYSGWLAKGKRRIRQLGRRVFPGFRF